MRRRRSPAAGAGGRRRAARARGGLASGAAVAAGAALAAAGCGGGGGPTATGATTDAKMAAQVVVDALRPSTRGLRAVTCGALDFALTYRCEVEREATRGEGLVCAVRSGQLGVGGLGREAKRGAPYCIAASTDAAERARRERLVVTALKALNGRSRLGAVVVGVRNDGFQVGCGLGFRTVQGGSRQTDDVVLQVIAVSVDTGRSVWDAFTVPVDGGAIAERSGADPRDKPEVNGYAKCALDGAGVASVAEDVRDTALLPRA